MQKHLKAFVDAINGGDLEQEIKAKLVDHPVIHFSDHAEKILSEGFLFGESNINRLDCTYENHIQATSGPGYNFAFNTLEWDVENDCVDYEVAGENSQRGLMGMHAETAILFTVDGVYTRHYDEFHQVVFWGPDAKLERAILLKNTGSLEIDGKEACDDNGNPVQCWTAQTASGVVFVEREEMLNLRECVIRSLIWLDQDNQLYPKIASEYKTLYEDEIQDMGLTKAVSEIPAQSRTRKPVEDSELDR